MSFTMNIAGDERIIQLAEGLQELLKDPRETLERAGDYVVAETDKQYDSQGSHLSSKWKKLAKSTERQKAMMGFGSAGILQRTGKMRESVYKDVKRYSVEVKNSVPYFQYHQLGMGHNPQRKVFATPERLKQDIVQIVNEDIHKKIAK